MNTTHLPSMSWPKSILVATDLNDLDSLLPVAIDQARVTGAMIWLLHVIPPEAYVSIEAGAYPFVGKEKEYRAAEVLSYVDTWLPRGSISAFPRNAASIACLTVEGDTRLSTEVRFGARILFLLSKLKPGPGDGLKSGRTSRCSWPSAWRRALICRKSYSSLLCSAWQSQSAAGRDGSRCNSGTPCGCTDTGRYDGSQNFGLAFQLSPSLYSGGGWNSRM
jgi:hypothetical protein